MSPQASDITQKVGSYVVSQDIYWLRPYMENVYIKERINDQITKCAGGVTGNTTYLRKRVIGNKNGTKIAKTGNKPCSVW